MWLCPQYAQWCTSAQIDPVLCRLWCASEVFVAMWGRCDWRQAQRTLLHLLLTLRITLVTNLLSSVVVPTLLVYSTPWRASYRWYIAYSQPRRRWSVLDGVHLLFKNVCTNVLLSNPPQHGTVTNSKQDTQKQWNVQHVLPLNEILHACQRRKGCRTCLPLGWVHSTAVECSFVILRTSPMRNTTEIRWETTKDLRIQLRSYLRITE